jgi:hypothetical protein
MDVDDIDVVIIIYYYYVIICLGRIEDKKFLKLAKNSLVSHSELSTQKCSFNYVNRRVNVHTCITQEKKSHDDSWEDRTPDLPITIILE